MNNQIKIFLKKLGATLLVIFLLDLSIGKTLEYLYFKTKRGSPMQHTTFSLKIADPDVLVFGSSRAQHHYSPDPFEDKMKLSFYNTGKDGQGIFYSWAVLKSELERSQKDKIIILDINPDEFDKDRNDYDRLSELLPYYKEHKEIREIIHMRGPFEKVKAMSNLYRYNSLVLPIMKNFILPVNYDFEDGYEPLDKPIRLPKLAPFYHPEQIDSLEIMAFRNFILEAKKASHKVYVYVSPSYKIYHRGLPSSVKIAQAICSELSVPFFNHLGDSLFLKNPSYFSDATHLNELGAEIYSEKVFTTILGKKTFLKNSKPLVTNTIRN